MKFMIGSYTKQQSRGIYTTELDAQGKLSEPVLYAEAENPTYLIKVGDDVFSVIKKGSEGGVGYFTQGQLQASQTLAAAAPCYVSKVDDLIMTTFYHDGLFAVYRFQDGALKPFTSKDYGAGSHPHFANRNPYDGLIYVCDLGLDKVLRYRLTPTDLELVDGYDAPLGSGPRHLVFFDRRVALLSELDDSLTILAADGSGLSELDRIPAHQADTTVFSGAAIRASRDGKFIYTSNRGDNTLNCFAFDGDHVRLIQSISSGGLHPRDFNLSDDDRFVVAANMASNNLTVLERDSDSGLLHEIQRITVFEPVCVARG